MNSSGWEAFQPECGTLSIHATFPVVASGDLLCESLKIWVFKVKRLPPECLWQSQGAHWFVMQVSLCQMVRSLTVYEDGHDYSSPKKLSKTSEQPTGGWLQYIIWLTLSWWWKDLVLDLNHFSSHENKQVQNQLLLIRPMTLCLYFCMQWTNMCSINNWPQIGLSHLSCQVLEF